MVLELLVSRKRSWTISLSADRYYVSPKTKQGHVTQISRSRHSEQTRRRSRLVRLRRWSSSMVNRRTRVRDQEREPIAADVKRFLREKARYALPSFALTADVTEAHRQVPVGPQDWHFLGAQSKRHRQDRSVYSRAQGADHSLLARWRAAIMVEDGRCEILNRTHKLGISERRCQWFVRWTREVAESTTYR